MKLRTAIISNSNFNIKEIDEKLFSAARNSIDNNTFNLNQFCNIRDMISSSIFKNICNNDKDENSCDANSQIPYQFELKSIFLCIEHIKSIDIKN